MHEAAAIGDIFVTTTGNIAVIGAKHFKMLKNGAILANAGHFNVEIDIGWLHANADTVIRRDGIETFMLKGKALHVLAEGRLVNLATPKGMGHPIEVMDLSFALQALCTLHIAKNGKTMKGGVYEVPQEIDERVANLKLASLGLSIDTLTKEQKKYSCSWDIGT
jgi:adenosylhomocysteinase